jgi:predicted NBD/HSP70 family sugar kinase
MSRDRPLDRPEPARRRVVSDPPAPRSARQPAGQNLVHAADHNLRVTLEALRRGGAMSRLDLARITGLTVPGITNIVRRLEADGLVAEEAGQAGSRANRFAIVPDGAVSLGVDIAGGRARLVAIDLAGRVLLRDDAPVDVEDPAPEIAGLASRALESLAAQGVGRVLGLGLVAVEGAEAVRAALAPFPVVVEPDTIAAALGERQFGAAAADDSFVYVLIGPSTRAGMIIGGAVFNGVEHKAGRLGTMRTGEDGRLLDEAMSIAALEGLDPEDPAVARWIEDASAHLMDSLIAIAAFIAPRVIFVGGRLPAALLDALVRRLGARRLERMIEPTQPYWLPELQRGSLDADAVELGIAAMPFLEFLLPDPRRPFRPVASAFSSEVDTGSREENAMKR